MASPQGTNGIVGDVLESLERRSVIFDSIRDAEFLPGKDIRASTPVGWDAPRMLRALEQRGWRHGVVEGEHGMLRSGIDKLNHGG